MATAMEGRLDRLEQDAARQEAAAGREWWVKWVAATTAVLSALAAFGAVRSQGYANEALFHSNQAVLFQAQASDAWAEFQANSLKRHINDNAATELRAVAGSAGAQQAAALDEAVRQKYRPQQDAAGTKARELEGRRDGERTAADGAQGRKDQAGLAVGVFQLGIGLASVAALTKRIELWLAGTAIGLGGAVILALALV
jgi:hypothetical protein